MSERQEEGAEQARAGRTGAGEQDQNLDRAVDAARREAEQRASAEIMALEQDLDRERENAATALEAVQRRLDDAEARATESSADHERQLIAERDEATAALREAQERLAALQRDAEEERTREDARRSDTARYGRFSSRWSPSWR